MKYFKIFFATVLLLGFLFNKSYSRWWIFGISKEEVSLQYIYINGIPIEEIKNKIIFYKELLSKGYIVIKGKAHIKNGKIASVRISLDGKETWQKTNLSDDGTFIYSFLPETEKSYKIYIEAMDTSGKLNEVERTFREVIVTEDNIRTRIESVLRSMAEEYCRENDHSFMDYVSESFSGDYMNLARAIRNDFSLFEGIKLEFIVNSVNVSGKGDIVVLVNFNRILISSKTGKMFSDKGMTEFKFKQEGSGIKLIGMKNPIIFGLSDADEIATGDVKSPTNEPIIIVDIDGTIEKLPLDEALNKIKYGETGSEDTNKGNTDADTVVSGTNLTLVTGGHPPGSFIFATGTVSTGSGDIIITSIVVSPSDAAWGWLDTGVSFIDLGTSGINSVSEVPESGYTSPSGIYLYVGHTYAFKLKDGKYGLLEMKSINWAEQKMVFDYKYQSSGSRFFK
ncbi:MAG: hypothetical protein QXO21_03665 [Candidatus Anstonellales archaeon]